MDNKKITIYDLAKASGVSVGTVTRALHNKPRISTVTREHVLAVAERMNYKANHLAQSLGRNKINIGVTSVYYIDNFKNEVEKGIRFAFSELREFNVDNEIYYVFNEEQSKTNTRKVIDKIIDFCDRKFNGIIIDGSIMNSLSKNELSYIQDSKTAIGMMINYSGSPEASVSVTVNGQCAGGLAAQMLWMMCGGKKVAIFIGSRSAPIHDQNVSGFTSFAQDHSFSDILVYEHMDVESEVIRQTDAMIRTHSDVAGVYIASSVSPIICTRLFEAGYSDKIKIVTTDLFDETREYLEKELVTATIFQNPFQIGYLITNNLYKHICNLPVEKDHQLAPQLILKSNVRMY